MGEGKLINGCPAVSPLFPLLAHSTIFKIP
jgi:hypothetical protein